MEPVSKWKLTGKLTGEKGDELSGNLNTRYIGPSRGSGFSELELRQLSGGLESDPFKEKFMVIVNILRRQLQGCHS